MSGRVARRQQGKWAEQEQAQAYQQQQMQQQYAPPPQQYAPPPAAAAPAEDDMMAKLEKLGELHDKGILTDEEFAAEKAKVLNL